MKTYSELERLSACLGEPVLPQAEQPWRGAHAELSTTALPENFWGQARQVITPHALEVSWLFLALRDAFYAEDRIDYYTKLEFFPRLASAALRCQQQSEAPSAHQLCAAVLHEAFAIYDELERGEFACLPISLGGSIADDLTGAARTAGYTSDANTREFFRNRGVEVYCREQST